MTDEAALATAPNQQPYNAIVDDLEYGLVPALAKVVTFTPKGLQLPDDLTFEQAQGVTHYIAEAIKRDVMEVNLLQLALGDIIHYAERRWGDTYTDYLDSTGLAYGTLANTAWVARSVDYSRRRADLSFAHHAVIAPLPPNEQREWLQRAAEDEIGANELRRQVQASKDVKAGKDPAQAAIIRSLHRTAQQITNNLDSDMWAETINRGLIELLAKRRDPDDTNIEWQRILESLEEWRWDNPATGYHKIGK